LALAGADAMPQETPRLHFWRERGGGSSGAQA
jgi:hypothetical protein